MIRRLNDRFPAGPHNLKKLTSMPESKQTEVIAELSEEYAQLKRMNGIAKLVGSAEDYKTMLDRAQ